MVIFVIFTVIHFGLKMFIISTWGSALFILLAGHARASVKKWVLGASRLFYPLKGVPSMSNNLTQTIMERYTLDLKLPKIVRLVEAPRCESEEKDMFGRNVFLHTSTGGIVEILVGQGFILEKEHMEYQFGENGIDEESNCYTALLLNKSQNISTKNGEKAMKEVAKWFIKYMAEYQHLDSLEWSPL